MSTVYYSPLSSILPLDALPQQLGFVKNGLATLLDEIYFKDLQHSQSPSGDAAQYALTIVTKKELGLEIPGTGIELLLNPGAAGNTETQFPVTLRYQWPVLAWIRGFDLETFSWQPGDFYQLVLTVLGITQEQALARALSVFLPGPDPIAQFVADYNAFYDEKPDIAPVPQSLAELQAVLEQQQGQESSLVVFAMYILDNADLEGTEERLEQMFASYFGGSVKDWFLRQITPRADASLELAVALEFPRNILIPLDANGNPKDAPAKSRLTFDPGAFTFSTETGIGYEEALGANLDSSQIGNTGFGIAITNAKLDLSTTTNIAEATADGRPEDFVGVFIENATISFPNYFEEDSNNSTAQLVGRNLLIGTGGLSGTIALEAKSGNGSNPALIRGKFGSFEVGLTSASLTFQQNEITASSIKGYLVIKELKDAEGGPAEIAIDVHIGSDGSFSITASEEQGIEALKIPDVVTLELTSLSVGRNEGRFFVSVSGALDFEAQEGIGKFIPDKIEIQKLTVWDDGQLELEGGSIVLPSAATLQIGPVAISITAIHFGSLEQNGRKYAFFGFDGGVSLDPGGVDARGDGIKFYFTVDGGPFDCFLRITSIAIDIIIPGSATPENAAVLLSGYLAMKEDGEYAGGVSVSLPKLSIAGSAAMRYNPKLPSFLIDLGLEISAPILLGSTGLGLYGFRGLLGLRYVASKSVIPLAEEDEWWKYYKAKISPDFKEGIQASKFDDVEGFSLGAGVTLATAPDAGYTFSAKIFFLLSLPEVFLLQGQGQILKQRIGLDTTVDPPFFALIAISSTSIEAAFGVDYNIPDGGEIAEIDAVLEMGFFWGNAGAWYFNLGKDQPEDRRVQALLLTFFKCYYYLMLSSAGIRTGAGVSYELNKEIGPFSVDLRAYMDMAGRITFSPLQVGGSIELGGHLRLSIFGFGFSISASAALTGEAPKPFIITGRLKACVEVLWDEHCVKVELTWTINPDLNFSEVPLLPDPKTAVQAVNVHTLETFPVYAAKTTLLPQPAELAAFVVPMDSYIDVELKQAVHPTKKNHPSLAKFSALGGSPEYTITIPPQKAKSARIVHELTVDSIELLSWSNGAWQPYDVYAAATPLQLVPWVTTDITKLPWGYWQKAHPTKHNKLRVLAQSPFSYKTKESNTPYVPPEDLGVGVEEVFCAPEERTIVCFDFEQTPLGALIPVKWYSMPEILYRVVVAGEIRVEPWQGFDRALCVEDDRLIQLLFPQSTARAELLLHTDGEAVEVLWYRRVPVDNPNGDAPLYEWQVVKTDEVVASQLDEPVGYDDLNNPILRADIRGLRCNPRRTTHCREPKRHIADALLVFLEALHANRQLLEPSFNLDRERYAGSFFGSVLYSETNAERVRYEATWNRGSGPLFIRIRDFLEYDCIIHLESNEREPVAFDRIERFLGIDVDERGEITDGFFLHALVEGREITIPGRSGYELRECDRACRTCLYRVCYESVEDAVYNESIPSDGEVEAEAETMIDAIEGSIQPIWRPDTHFLMKIVTTDFAEREDGNDSETYTNTYMIGWRTAGPVGHFHQSSPAYQQLPAEQKDEFKLASLQHYVDYARSYPNADGRLTNAKPLFYVAPRLDVFFLKPYVVEMYRDWDAYNGAETVHSALEVEIVHPAPAPDAPDDVYVVSSWELVPSAYVPVDIEVIINMTENGDPCGDVEPPGPTIDVKSTFEVPQLEPLKLYTAVFRNAFHRASEEPSREEVHRYVFQTSRYPDFVAQIGDPAVYEVAVEADAAALAEAVALVGDPNASSEDLKQRFADTFDRLIDGIFRLDALPPATATEFNVLRLARTSRVLGILVRSPEPLNDPKMPAAELATTVKLKVVNDSNYEGLHAKDAARVLLTNAVLDVPPGLHHLTFHYRRWNGTQYANISTATAQFTRNN